MPKDITDKGRLLAVLAHPDDETFGMGGTLALYARSGVDVYLICATRGEAGDVDEKYLEGYDSIADLRVSELQCAAEKLGLKEVYNLNYHDSGMLGAPENLHPHALSNSPIDQVARDIEHYIRLIQPQVVITHDPIGSYFHPDHVAIHQATVMAFFNASLSAESSESLPPFAPQKLYFHSINSVFLRIMLRLMPLIGWDPRHFGKNKDINLEAIANVRFPVHAAIRYRKAAKFRDEATFCHKSQGGDRGGDQTLIGVFRRLLSLSRDTFMQAYPTPLDGKVSRDLFNGVNFH